MSHINERFIVARCPRCRYEFKIELLTKKIGKDRRLKVMLDIQNIIRKNYPKGISIQHLYGIFKKEYSFTDGVIRRYIIDMVRLKLLRKPDPRLQFYATCEGVH